jgi:hypothetical protein
MAISLQRSVRSPRILSANMSESILYPVQGSARQCQVQLFGKLIRVQKIIYFQRDGNVRYEVNGVDRRGQGVKFGSA